jgi:WD40 repeat protein
VSTPARAVPGGDAGPVVRVGTAAAWQVTLDDAPAAVAVTARGGDREPAIAVLGADGLVTLLDTAGRRVAAAVASGGCLAAAWSPDGAVLAVGGPEGAYRWTADGGLEPLRAGGWCQAQAWAPDGRLAVADDRSAAVFDPRSLTGQLASGWVERAWRTPEVASTVTGLAWLRDGRELAVAGYGGVRAFSRDRLARELAYAGSLLAVAVSPDGRWLVSGNQDASVHVWRLRDGEELEMAGYPRKVTRVAFDATGRWLAADGGPVTTVWDFSGKGPGGTSPRLLPAPPDGATALAWHPRRPVLATGGADGAVAVWDLAAVSPGREAVPRHRDVVRANDPVTALAWLDEVTVIAATRSGTVASLWP